MYWCFPEYRNVSLRTTPEFLWCYFQIVMLTLIDKESQPLHGEGINQRLLIYLSDPYAHGMYFALVMEVMKANRCENPSILS